MEECYKKEDNEIRSPFIMFPNFSLDLAATDVYYVWTGQSPFFSSLILTMDSNDKLKERRDRAMDIWIDRYIYC